MRKQMQAVKPFGYATRRLQAGDVFDASRRDARLLEAIGKAVPYVEPVDPLADLRAEAAKLGVKADGRWGEAKLRDEIAKAKTPKKSDDD